LKGAAISTVLSWIIVFVALAGMPYLGDFSWLHWDIPVPPEYRAGLVIGLIFLTWRTFSVNLCFSRSGVRSLVDLPVLMFIALIPSVVTFVGLTSNEVIWNAMLKLAPLTPTILACMVAVKLLLAFLGFRASLKRRFLTASAMLGYMVVWMLLVAALLMLVLHLPLPSKVWLLPVSLVVVLLVPLARISFCPIAIEHSRQT
jgi:hypothetical protein